MVCLIKAHVYLSLHSISLSSHDIALFPDQFLLALQAVYSSVLPRLALSLEANELEAFTSRIRDLPRPLSVPPLCVVVVKRCFVDRGRQISRLSFTTAARI